MRILLWFGAERAKIAMNLMNLRAGEKSGIIQEHTK